MGRTVRVESTPEGRIAGLSVRNAPARGQWVAFARYEYDDEGQLVAATDADGFRNRYAYDDGGRHFLVENGYKTGLVFYFRYDREGRCFESWGAYPGKIDLSLASTLPTHLSDGQTPVKGVHHVRVEYLPDGFRHVYDSTRLESYACNEHGLLDMADIGGSVSKATFRDDGWVMTETDALKGVTAYERDARGGLLSITDPLGRVTRFERDARGLTIRVTDPAGGVTEVTRDGRGNVEVVRDAAGALTSYQRDGRGLVTAIVDSRGATTQLHYDAEANLVAATLPNGGVWRYAYDAFGRLVSRTDPLGATTHYTYSDRGDLRSERNALGEVTRYSHDGDGYLVQHVSALGAITKFAWGGLHKLVQRIDANGHRVVLRYNHEGELLEVENEGGEVHLLERDLNGLLIGERTFDGRRLRYRNDVLGRPTLIENGAGEYTELAYDAAHQLLSRALSDNTTESFEYDARGELVKATNMAGEFTFERDPMGRIVREAQTVAGATHWVEIDLDGEGDRVARRTSLGHTEAVQRDALGARTQTVLDGQHQLSHTNDVLGREVARFLPGGGRIETGYDAVGRVAARRAMDGSVPLPAPGTLPDWQRPTDRGVTVDARYRYSADGELVESWDKDRGTTSYRYDPLGQLLAMVPDQAKSELFRFDPRGNIHEGDPGGPQRVYGQGNRLLRKGDTLFTWDDDGRLVEKRITYPGTDDPDEVWRYRWNGAGLLSQVTRPDGAKVRFVYDPFARRMGKGVVPGPKSTLRASNTRFVWDGDVLAHEIRYAADEAGDPVVAERTYLFEDESFEPAAHREGGEWVHYVNDQNGCVQAVLDSTAGLQQTMSTSAWGGDRSQSDYFPPLRMAGQYKDDETGFCYTRWRQYDPDVGRFVSADPIGILGGWNEWVHSPNLFVWQDPLGLYTKVKKKDIKTLKAGGDVEVGSIKEADALLNAAFPDAVKVKGPSPGKVPDFSQFKQQGPKAGKTLYHKDYIVDPDTGRICGHSEGNPHGDQKHINIKLASGKKVAILIKPK